MKLISSLFLSFCLIGSIYSAEHKLRLADPFDNIQIDEVWNLEDNEKFVASFEHSENEDILLAILQGLPQKKVSIIELHNQLNKTKGYIGKAPLFSASFPYAEDDVRIENWHLDSINDKEVLVLINKSEVEHTVNYNGNITEYVTYDLNFSYIIATNKQFFIITFSFPEDEVDEWHALIDSTMHQLVK